MRNTVTVHLAVAAAWCLLVALLCRPWWVTDKDPAHQAQHCPDLPANGCVAHLVLGKLHICVQISASHLLKAILELVLSPFFGFLASSVSAFNMHCSSLWPLPGSVTVCAELGMKFRSIQALSVPMSRQCLSGAGMDGTAACHNFLLC